MSRSRPRFALLAAVASAALVAGLFAASDPAAAAPARPRPPAGLPHARHGTKLTAGQHGLPRVLGKQRSTAGEPGQAGLPSSGGYAFLLQLDQTSTLARYHQLAGRGRTAARAGAKQQYTQVRSAQERTIRALPSGSRVLYRTHSLLAGVAVYTDVHNYAALRSITGVKAVYPIAPKRPANSYAVPLQHAPQAWQQHGDLGANTTVAVIDTGIDYTHADLGGPGTTAAYQTALAADTTTPTYPDTTKVAGGYDLAGDAYDASDPAHTTPAPDTNPLDCNGHGSHVAGTIAGYGENTDGSTFTGDYASLPTDPTAYQQLFRIGPGMAPKARLLAYKVFGCGEEATTDLVGAAIDMAMDPNGDGDPSDHADVINMSLGGDFASPQDGDSVESNLASQAGVTVVAASGNAGDAYDAGGSPGDATRVIAVAASEDAYSQLDSVHLTGTALPAYGAERSVAYDWSTKPDLSGTVVALAPDDDNNDACLPLDPTDTALVAGKIALVQWTDDDDVRQCDSATRADNLAAAGAVGYLLGADQETPSAGITGDATIPGVLITKSGRDAITTALNASQTVTVTGTGAGDFPQTVTANNDTVASFSSRGINDAGNVKPDVTAVGATVFSAGMGTGNQGVSDSGTSMATPMVAGLAALVRSAHKDWTPEEVKADIMNTADQDLYTGDNHTGQKYAPNRVGAGRIDAASALNNLVLAYNASDAGAVSVSFGPVQVYKATTLTKTIKVANKSLRTATYSLAYQALTSVPGVSYKVSPSTVTLAPLGTASVTVTFGVTNPKLLTKTIDPTVSPTAGDLPREFQADASGRVVLTPTGSTTGTALRVPVYSAPRPASNMYQAGSLTFSGGAVQTKQLSLLGTGVKQGSGPSEVLSTVSGFELLGENGVAPTCTGTVTTLCAHFPDERSADLRYVGSTSNVPQLNAMGYTNSEAVDQNCGNDGTPCGFLYFSVTTQAPWRTAASQNEFDIYISTNLDNTPDAVLYNTRLGGSDVFVSELVSLTDPNNPVILDDELIDDRFGDQDMALFNSDTMVLPLWLPMLQNLPGFSTGMRIRYGVLSYSNESADPIDDIGVNLTNNTLSSTYLSMNVFRPGIAVYGALNPNDSLLRYVDLPGSLTVRRDAFMYNYDKPYGLLMVHFHNTVGYKAKPVTLRTAPSVSLKLSATTIVHNHSEYAYVTVADNSYAYATGRVYLRQVGGGVMASGTLTAANKGKITLKFTPVSKGTFHVRAEYGGDGVYTAGNSGTLTIKVT